MQFVSVPEEGVPRTGAVKVGLVRVLLVSVSVPANVANVPVVGNVMEVVAEVVSVRAWLPLRFSVAAALFAMPVPPLAAPKTPVTSVVRTA